ncbi:MAG: hypothetical protein WCY89_00460 [Flavobacteriaceae bacterium]
MENYTNKHGYILAIIIASIYALAIKEAIEFIEFCTNFIALLLMSSIFSAILSVFWKFKNFGKILGVTTLIISVLSFAGNKLHENENRKKVIDEIITQKQKEADINLITSNFKNAYTEFNRKLNNDNRKDILNQLILNNDIFFGDTKIVLEKIKRAEDYYDWIKTTNDSLISDMEKQLNKYQINNSLSENEILKAQYYLEMMSINLTTNNFNTGNVIFAMRNIVAIKNNCKHELKNGKILFYDNKCLDKWNKAELQLNEAIQNLNKHRENLINK